MLSYIYNKQCWFSHFSLMPSANQNTLSRSNDIFGPSNALMSWVTKSTKLRPANALFFVLHFINCFHTFEDTTVKQLYLIEKRYIFSKSKAYLERTYNLYHRRLTSNILSKDKNHWDIYVISNISFRLKYIKTKTNHTGKSRFHIKKLSVIFDLPS